MYIPLAIKKNYHQYWLYNKSHLYINKYEQYSSFARLQYTSFKTCTMSSPRHVTLLRPTQEYQTFPLRVFMVARMDSKYSTGRPDKHNLQQHSLAVLNP